MDRCNRCGEILSKPEADKFYTICKHCGNQVVTFVPYEISEIRDSGGNVLCNKHNTLSMQELVCFDTTKVGNF